MSGKKIENSNVYRVYICGTVHEFAEERTIEMIIH